MTAAEEAEALLVLGYEEEAYPSAAWLVLGAPKKDWVGGDRPPRVAGVYSY